MRNLNFRGKFKIQDENGELIVYNRHDVVYYEGNSYMATGRTSGYTPRHTHRSARWKKLDLPDDNINGGYFTLEE